MATGKTNSGSKTASINANLLHNWYFKNPINQRGVSGVVSDAGYFIDRWKLVSGTVEITDVGLILDGTIEQILEFAVGQTTKASVLTSTGVMDGVYDDSTKTLTITATELTIIATKLELGDTQTLAHEENGALVLNEIPDYAEQFEKCSRYLIKISKNTLINGYGYNATTSYIHASVPTKLRTVPIINGNASVSIRSNGLSETISNVSVYAIDPSAVQFVIVSEENFNKNAIGGYFNNQFYLSAEL